MAKMISMNHDGEGYFVDLNDREYALKIPKELVDFILMKIFPSINLWHYEKSELNEEEFHISIYNEEIKKTNFHGLSFRWSNNKITNLTIDCFFTYKINKLLFMNELIHLLQNQEGLREYLLNNAELDEEMREALLNKSYHF